MRRRLLGGNRGEQVNEAFTMSVKTDNTGTSAANQFTIPTVGGTINPDPYNYNIKTSDGQVINGITGSYTITFPTAGIYDIEITGTFTAIYFFNTGDRQKLLQIKNWGIVEFRTFYRSFFGCNNLKITAVDSPNLSNCQSLNNMFTNCTSITNEDFSGWNTAGITLMEAVFLQASNFIGNGLSTWNTSNVTTMLNMFRLTKFSGNVSNWDVSKVNDMRFFADGTTTFISNISNWNPIALTQASPFISLPDNYPHLDAIYNSWSQKALKPNVTINFGAAKYTSAGQAARNILTGTFGWIITDGGLI